jgi:hypothetical protein
MPRYAIIHFNRTVAVPFYKHIFLNYYQPII